MLIAGSIDTNAEVSTQFALFLQNKFSSLWFSITMQQPIQILLDNKHETLSRKEFPSL